MTYLDFNNFSKNGQKANDFEGTSLAI
jgi:hypothetical protein